MRWRTATIALVQAEAIRDRLVHFCMRTLTSDENFPREWGGPYKLALGTVPGRELHLFPNAGRGARRNESDHRSSRDSARR
jgi:hypothetical protein